MSYGKPVEVSEAESKSVLGGIREIMDALDTVEGLRLLYQQVRSGYWPILEEDREVALAEIKAKGRAVKGRG